MKSPPPARGSQEAGFTQPRAHLIVLSVWARPELICLHRQRESGMVLTNLPNGHSGGRDHLYAFDPEFISRRPAEFEYSAV